MAAFDENPIGYGGGVVVEEKPKAAPKSKAQKLAEFRLANQEAYKAAQERVCNCAPSKADMLLVDRYEGCEDLPIDEISVIDA